MSEWLKALSDVVQTRIEKVPHGWKTAKQIGKEINRTSRHALNLLNELKEKKLVDTQKFVIDMGGKIGPVPHYKILNRPKK